MNKSFLKRNLSKINFFVFLFISTLTIEAQVCLNGWDYRRTIIVDNSLNSNALGEFQINFEINTAVLISNNAMNIDGDDIRILNKNGVMLPYYIEKGTINTSTTKIWVRLDTINALSIDSIFLFYGSAIALPLNNPEATFDFFDDFDLSTLDALKWDFCNGAGGTNSLLAGNITLSSTVLTTGRAIIKTKKTFGFPIISEANIKSITNGNVVLGQVNSIDKGYGMMYDSATFTTMRAMELDNVICQNLSEISPITNVQALQKYGIWQFSWTKQANQMFNWPGALTKQVRTGFNNSYENNLKSVLGIQNKVSSVTADWYRVRKYAAYEPITTIEKEMKIGNPLISVNSNSPVCITDSIRLSAATNNLLMYLWTGPLGLNCTNMDTTFEASLAKAGTYTLQTSDSTGCNIKTYNLNVVVNSLPIKGSILGDTAVCSTGSNLSLKIVGNTGVLNNWQKSETTTGPWIDLVESTNILTLNNSSSTLYYRGVLSNGGCVINTDSVLVQVDNKTNGGFLVGTNKLCFGEYLDVQLQGKSGTMLSWTSSTNGGALWDTLTTTSLDFIENSISDTMLIFASVQSGVCPIENSDTLEVIVHPLPIINYFYNGTCEGTLTNFTNLSTIVSGNIIETNWDYGDGNSALPFSPTHLYTAGAYSIFLIEKSNQGCIDSVRKNIIINPLPKLAYLTDLHCQFDSVSFLNTTTIGAGAISSYSWLFGDGNTSTLINPKHTYTTEGSFTVKLIATSDSSCVDSISQVKAIYQKPVATFISDSVCLGAPVSFVNSTIETPGGINYEWRFGDGTTSPIKHPTHQFLSDGTYNVMLIATSTYNCTDTIIEVSQTFPKPNASFVATTHCLGDTLPLVNNSTSSAAVMYSWTFGDSFISSDSLPKHVYLTPNNYKVALTIMNSFSCSDDTSSIINVAELPNVNYNFQNDCAGSSIQFYNQTTPTTGVSYAWNFGDNNFSASIAPAHTYTVDTSYFVTLVATSSSSCVDSSTKSILIYPNPKANFIAPDVCEGFPTVITNLSSIKSGTIVTNNWNFGDGNASLIQNPIHEYLNPSKYSITLITTSDLGCIDDTTIITTVTKGPIANFTFNDICINETALFTNITTTNLTTSFIWNFDDSTSSFVHSPEHNFKKFGVYSVKLIARDDLGCSDSITKPIIVYDLPSIKTISDSTISKGLYINLWAKGGDAYVWTPTESLDNPFIENPNAHPLVTTKYEVEVTDNKGCVNYDSLTVFVNNDYYVNIYNVITPNDNGKNDFWVIENIETYPENKVYVYDQSGRLVFHDTSYTNDWEGTFNGENLTDGTYYFVITLDEGSPEYKGTLTIIRNLN